MFHVFTQTGNVPDEKHYHAGFFSPCGSREFVAKRLKDAKLEIGNKKSRPVIAVIYLAFTIEHLFVNVYPFISSSNQFHETECWGIWLSQRFKVMWPVNGISEPRTRLCLASEHTLSPYPMLIGWVVNWKSRNSSCWQRGWTYHTQHCRSFDKYISIIYWPVNRILIVRS